MTKIITANGDLLRAQAADRYAAAVERRGAIEREWLEEGAPLTTTGGVTGKAIVPHPLVTMLKEADVLCDRLSKALSRRNAVGGRPVGAASAPDREAVPPLALAYSAPAAEPQAEPPPRVKLRGAGPSDVA